MRKPNVRCALELVHKRNLASKRGFSIGVGKLVKNNYDHYKPYIYKIILGKFSA